MKITVITTDGRQTTEPTIPDFVRLERNLGMTATDLEDDTSLEPMLYLCFAALSREGEVSGSFDDWLDTVRDIDSESDDEDDEAAEDPTGGGEAA